MLFPALAFVEGVLSSTLTFDTVDTNISDMIENIINEFISKHAK